MSNTVERILEYKGMQLVVILLDYGIPENMRSDTIEGRHRCGYVGLPALHALSGKDYSHIEVDVHGGLTFAGKLDKARDTRVSDRWFLGFDCAHYLDKFQDWPVDRVLDECQRLADQLYRLRSRWVNWFIMGVAKFKEWWESDFRKRK